MGDQRGRGARQDALTNEQLVAVRAIFARYARVNAGGVPIRCDTSRRERTDGALWRWQGNNDKVILRDKAAAAAAAVELAEVFGHETWRAYECPRSRSGHYHVTSDLQVRDA